MNQIIFISHVLSYNDIKLITNRVCDEKDAKCRITSVDNDGIATTWTVISNIDRMIKDLEPDENYSIIVRH